MNKEQIIDEAYENYLDITDKKWMNSDIGDLDDMIYDGYLFVDGDDIRVLKREEFIYIIKEVAEFSEKWGLKIEERELSDDERQKWVIENIDWVRNSDDPKHEANKYLYRGQPLIYGDTVPTRLITLTYNNETIESYE